jgi:hypothetical protein
MKEMRVGARKSRTCNKVELDADWDRGYRTQAWELLWRRILAEVDVGGKILIPDDARDHFPEEQNEDD